MGISHIHAPIHTPAYMVCTKLWLYSRSLDTCEYVVCVHRYVPRLHTNPQTQRRHRHTHVCVRVHVSMHVCGTFIQLLARFCHAFVETFRCQWIQNILHKFLFGFLQIIKNKMTIAAMFLSFVFSSCSPTFLPALITYISDSLFCFGFLSFFL